METAPGHHEQTFALEWIFLGLDFTVNVTKVNIPKEPRRKKFLQLNS